MDILSRLVLPTGTKGCFLSRLPDPGQKGRPGVPGWETGTTRVFQPGQIRVSVAVIVRRISCRSLPADRSSHVHAC